MQRKHLTLIVLVVAAVVLTLALRSYFSPERVVQRKLGAAIEAFEQERILGAIAPVSRGYSDDWGQSYESLAGHMREAMESFEDLQVDLEEPEISRADDELRVRLRFVLWGVFEGQRGYVIGTIAEPVTITQLWRKEAAGWRIATTETLDIPELRAELDEMRPPP
jgi:hypothetical protein